jgi:hypothetical protein
VRSSFMLPALVGLVLDGSAVAASPGFMMQDCKNSAQILFQDFEARSEAKYEREKGSDPFFPAEIPVKCRDSDTTMAQRGAAGSKSPRT